MNGPARPLRLLLLGGTKFLGRACVEAARARGHALTLFHRGRHDPGAFPELEHILGDRTKPADDPAGLGALVGPAAVRAGAARTWDAVLDLATYLPRDVEASTAALAGRVGHYTYVSSVSALASHAAPDPDESAPAAELTDAQRAEAAALAPGELLAPERLGELYGPLKAECERVATAAFGARALVVRPGLIVGPHDPSERFTYWPLRLLRGGDVLAPGRPGRPVMFIDVRDLAEWMIRMVERRASGTYLADGPASPLPLGEVLDACAREAKRRGAPPARLVWKDDAWLLERKVGPWMEMPLWIPESDPEAAGFMTENCAKARAAGLVFRPLAETIRATLDWALTRPPGVKGPAGLAPEREAELLRSGT